MVGPLMEALVGFNFRWSLSTIFIILKQKRTIYWFLLQGFEYERVDRSFSINNDG